MTIHRSDEPSAPAPTYPHPFSSAPRSSNTVRTTQPPAFSTFSPSESPRDIANASSPIPLPFVQAPLSALQAYARNITEAGEKAIAAVKEPIEKRKEWNDKNLAMRLAGDATAAAAAGGLVAPLISIIDRGIIENASDRRNLTESMSSQFRKLFFRPHVFLSSKPFLLIFSLYGGTYLSANLLDTFTSTIKARPASSVTSGTSKFMTTSAANLSLCLYKDSQFTKMFGAAGSKATPVPGITYALFAARDSLTIFASFNVPPLLAPVLPVGEEVEKYASRASIAQFIAPAAVQAISTPLHLLGLDLYNRPRGTDGVTLGMRAGKVVADWGKSFVARVARIVPAFGVGGIVNTRVRGKWMRELE